MIITDYTIPVKSKSDVFDIYPIGDIHLGARDVAEDKLRKLIKKIQANDKARWIGGGDMCECISPSELRRWEYENMPDWMFEGDADTVRDKLRDVINCQKQRFYKLFKPIKGKCIGLIEGNHEFSLRKYHNLDHHGFMCSEMQVPDLSSEAFVRLKFTWHSTSRVVTLFICHGHGGGRTQGSEPNKLATLAGMFDADVLLRGHSHQFCINPTIVTLGVSTKKTKNEECIQNVKHTANWGTWRLSYKAGASTYTSRSLYRPRPLSALKISIRPYRTFTKNKTEGCVTDITLSEQKL